MLFFCCLHVTEEGAIDIYARGAVVPTGCAICPLTSFYSNFSHARIHPHFRVSESSQVSGSCMPTCQHLPKSTSIPLSSSLSRSRLRLRCYCDNALPPQASGWAKLYPFKVLPLNTRKKGGGAERSLARSIGMLVKDVKKNP
jgi:hypothetical protein